MLLCEVGQYQLELLMLFITTISSVLISAVRTKEKWQRKKTHMPDTAWVHASGNIKAYKSLAIFKTNPNVIEIAKGK